MNENRIRYRNSYYEVYQYDGYPSVDISTLKKGSFIEMKEIIQ